MMRNVSLLASRAVEALQQELTVSFSAERFPVDLDVVGSPSGGSALVTIRVPGSDREESRYVEFPRSRFSKTAILAAVNDLLMPFEKATAPNLYPRKTAFQEKWTAGGKLPRSGALVKK